MSPEVQVLAYAILPSESVIAHSAEFSTETCFDNKVSQRGSSSALCRMKEEIFLWFIKYLVDLHVAEVTVDDIADASPFFGAFVYN